ncbi:MotA/TolQ/ExbB proton channel family protein [Bermanella marisrubri]|uniref:MotA/TolQ/ExbB proton channel family protein n=1 Tax=Bermanella marisrubri TaxID=207949 RepID=Q1MY75_9GAMM|nr:MotA/TolQ/ExbB proton channel family protein [Bermanella marisrubri]EAT10935.1 MotA/TolQ/ExbB proton channel family protein [Oceanobacter sp. RED65] [Bermanella marisrubri]QIZ83722.1 MotA/TolQ/ExbB proton channel family protein [Bermanella marisrubri]
MNLATYWLDIIGGPVVLLLVLFSICASALVLIKLYQYWMLAPKDKVAADDLLRLFSEDNTQAVLELSENQKNGRIQLIAQAQDMIQNNGLNMDHLKTELFRRARLLLRPLQDYLRPLEIIATLAPLLGLFGTVLGMIEAFKAMEAAGSQVDPAVLSGGIWQALLTTAVGLAVAIPVTLIHGALEKRAENTAAQMENDIEFMLTHIAMKLSPSTENSLRSA